MQLTLSRTKHSAVQILRSPSSQRGGTVLGIILGVMVGLGAALAVAIYVTKVPVPFVNKGNSRGTGTEQDAAEAQKNKNWDPNAPLYGKNPARPNATASGAVGGAVGGAGAADPGATPGAPAAPAAVPPVTASAKPAAPAAGASAPKVAAAKPTASSPSAAAPKPTSADPLGDLAKAKTAAAPSAGSTAGGADPFIYLVQAGAFRTPEDAEAQRVKLSLLGMDAKVTEREQSGRTVFRVRVGPYNSKDDAEKTKEKLDGGGFETALVRVQR